MQIDKFKIKNNEKKKIPYNHQQQIVYSYLMSDFVHFLVKKISKVFIVFCTCVQLSSSVRLSYFVQLLSTAVQLLSSVQLLSTTPSCPINHGYLQIYNKYQWCRSGPILQDPDPRIWSWQIGSKSGSYLNMSFQCWAKIFFCHFLTLFKHMMTLKIRNQRQLCRNCILTNIIWIT